jgi:hypothetical protein
MGRSLRSSEAEMADGVIGSPSLAMMRLLILRHGLLLQIA